MDIQRVLENLSQINFTAIDFETANEQRNSLCSIGIVKVMRGKIVEEINLLIKPKELRFSEINYQIHKLSEADFINALELNYHWEKLAPFFEEQLIVAHNATFDISVLKQTLSEYDLKYPIIKYLCSQKLAQEAFTDLVNYRLADVAKYLNLKHNHHNALSDASISAEIAIRAIPIINHSFLDFNNEELTGNISKVASEEKKDRWNDLLFAGKRIESSVLKPNLNVENQNNIFYNNKVVFTGDLKAISRQDAAARIQNMGADVNGSISKKTNIVVIGQGAGPSKMKMIDELKGQGYNIRILNEDEFLHHIEV